LGWVLAQGALFGCAEGAGTALDRDALLDPESCSGCHPVQYREWSGSMHAYAADDPVFLAMNRRGQRETDGELGPFCVSCHAPMAVREGATTDGLNLDEVPRQLKGVTCFFCHTVRAVAGTHNNPLELADDMVLRGEYADPVGTSAHSAGYSPFLDRDAEASASLCGACHDVVINEHAAIERTFQEWRQSVFSEAGGATCGQCHMDQSLEAAPIADAPGTVARRLHDHSMPGVDLALTPFPEMTAQRDGVQALLDATLQSALCVVDLGGASAIRVILDNIGAGHGFPSGAAQDRRVWVEIVAEADSSVVYASGMVADGTAVTESADPDLWLFRDCMFDAAGAPTHMFWEADRYESNQLAAQVTLDPGDPRFYQTHVVQSFPRAEKEFFDAVPERVTMRVRVRPIGFDVLDDLVAGGDLDEGVRDAVPTFDIDLGAGPVLEWTPERVNGRYVEQGLFEASCVTESNLDVTADKTAASLPGACQP
jgi:hypothetical protein